MKFKPRNAKSGEEEYASLTANEGRDGSGQTMEMTDMELGLKRNGLVSFSHVDADDYPDEHNGVSSSARHERDAAASRRHRRGQAGGGGGANDGNGTTKKDNQDDDDDDDDDEEPDGDEDESSQSKRRLRHGGRRDRRRSRSAPSSFLPKAVLVIVLILMTVAIVGLTVQVVSLIQQTEFLQAQLNTLKDAVAKQSSGQNEGNGASDSTIQRAMDEIATLHTLVDELHLVDLQVETNMTSIFGTMRTWNSTVISETSPRAVLLAEVNGHVNRIAPELDAVRALASENEASVKIINNKIAEENRLIENLSKDVEAYKSQMSIYYNDVVSASLSNITRQLNSVAHSLATLNVTSLVPLIDQAAANTTLAMQQVAAMKQVVDGLPDLNKLQDSMNDLTTKVDALSLNVQSEESLVKMLEERVVPVKNQVDILAQQYSDLKARVDALG